MNRLPRLALVTFLACTTAWTTAYAQQVPVAEAPQQAIGELECRTLLRLSGEERDFTLLYLHGFVSGRSNQQLLPVKELAEATDRLLDRCIDKPSDKVLTVLEQVRAARR